MWYDDEKLSTLIGKTMKSVEKIDDSEIVFTTVDDEQFKLYHSQDCCESVYIESVVGDLQNLVGAPILLAEESSSSDRPSDVPAPEYEPESQTWTFYKFGTMKGYVDIRFLGESNGYYSEGVSFCKLP
jgi:hypothetical protein